MRKLRTVLFAGLFAAAISSPAMAQTEIQLGVQGGLSNVKAGDLISASGGTYGVIGQVFMPIGNEKMKFGLQFGGALETAKESISVTSGGNSVSAKSSAKWSIDLLPMISYDLGGASVMAGAGLSILSAEISFGVSSQNTTFSGKNSQTHLGWKIAGGLNFDLSENFVGFAQLHYAQYQGKKYFGSSLLDESPKIFSGRVGLMYKF